MGKLVAAGKAGWGPHAGTVAKGGGCCWCCWRCCWCCCQLRKDRVASGEGRWPTVPNNARQSGGVVGSLRQQGAHPDTARGVGGPFCCLSRWIFPTGEGGQQVGRIPAAQQSCPRGSSPASAAATARAAPPRRPLPRAHCPAPTHHALLGPALPVQVAGKHLLPGVVGQAGLALDPGAGGLTAQRLAPPGRLVAAGQDVVAAGGGVGTGRGATD